MSFSTLSLEFFLPKTVDSAAEIWIWFPIVPDTACLSLSAFI